MHKVFINDKPLIFEGVYTPPSGFDKNLEVMSESKNNIDDVLAKLEEVNTKGVIYLCASPDQAWNSYVSRYVLIEAAGGVVKNNRDELLVIFRKKRWDLPKGKLDYEETPEGAAVREVKEECGLNEVEIEKFLLKTFHTYHEKSKFILKKTHWYSMNTSDDSELLPQAEEEIEEARWMSREVVNEKVLPSTYASIQEVLNTFFDSR